MDRGLVAERIRAVSVDGLRQRAASVDGGEVLEIDGLVLSLTNLADASLNAVGVEREPRDANRALAEAEAAFRARGMPWFGIEVEVGAHPRVERAILDAGLELLFSHPALAAETRDVARAPTPEGVSIEEPDVERDLEGMRAVETEAFGTAVEVAAGLVGPTLLARPDARPWVARDAGRVMGGALGVHLGGTTGIFGVGVLEEARGRGVGAALTSAAARSFPETDLAWLWPSELADPLYRRLGFEEVSTWDIWIRPQAPPVVDDA